jgi:hypothetical protein
MCEPSRMRRPLRRGGRPRFFYIARASAREARFWIRKAIERKLTVEKDSEVQIALILKATKLLNNLISYRRQRGKFDMVKEARAEDLTDSFTEAV